MNLQPIGDRIIVRREAAGDKTAGGILLPDTAKEKPQRGTILAVGPGKVNAKSGERVPMQLKAGDKVLFAGWAGDEYRDRKPQEGEILIMREDEVMAVIE
jgi:chaperonin GroES